jgi:glycerophosphoryl diester phosphodiesterase
LVLTSGMSAQTQTPIIVAHRGLHAVHAENSLAAFAAAWDARIQWCECDVHATADGVPLIIHDETLDRTTSMQGLVREKQSAELANAVPTLRQALAIMPADSGMLIEIKPTDESLITAVLREVPGHRCILQSFDPRNLLWANELAPNVETALLVESEDSLAQAAIGPWQGVNIDQKLLDSPALANIRRRKRLGAWTVNMADEITRAIHAGVEVLITNAPLLARSLSSGQSA